MRKKTLLTATTVLALVMSMVLVQEVKVAEAETLGPVKLPQNNNSHITISSPQNTTYYENSVLVEFTVKAFYSVEDVGYSLDDGPVERITDLKFIKSEDTPGVYLFKTVYYLGRFYLKNLQDGNHSITIYEGVQYSMRTHGNGYEVHQYSSVNFTVDSAPPTLANLSIENRTYNQTDLPLSFAVDKEVSWVGYSLDDHANVTLSGNTTLSGLSDGVHSIVVYANDTAGNMGKSTLILFSVQKSTRSC